ncbi:Fc.00g040250.m01.CDS01 [Cosmosporella sp. VM-42]
MPNIQVMEEELQQSVMLSDEDAEYETAGEASTTNAMNSVEPEERDNDRDANANDGDIELSDQDASGEELEELDEDAEGEEDNDYLLHQQISVGGHQGLEQTQVEEEGDVDASGEEDDQGEAVGAVKVKPGDSDEEDEDEDAESEASDLPSAPEEESEEEAPWEEAEDVNEDDEESEVAPNNNCVFCKQDEENDPSEDFEVYLACAGCGENAHQQCARDAAAMSERNNPRNWRCPECFHEDSEADDQAEDEDMEDVRPTSQQSNLSKITTNDSILAPPSNAESETHSLANEVTVADDTSRSLRKRKTSSVEPDDNSMSLRKRRRNQSDEPNSSHEDALDTGNSTETTRQHRTLRLKVTRPPPVSIEKRTRTSLIIKIQVRPGNLKEILSRRKRDRKRVPGSAVRPPRPAATPKPNTVNTVNTVNTPNPAPPLPILPTPFTSDSYSQPFYSFFDRETDDMKSKPYGGILTEAEADTSKTLPMTEDRRRFDQAKQKAEDEWRARILAIQADAEVPVRKPKKTNENASQIECIEFGGWEIDTWYAAPYPAEYSRNRVLYICEFCLKYMNSDYVAWRHKLKCPAKHPPGDEIYRQGSVSVFEVDGRKNPVYCQNLCLLAKLFLGSKTLYYDVEPFLFYVLCEYDDCGYHFVGYFSKEKRASSQNNVSCILTLPIHQRKGYGNLLIDFSYLLTKVEQKTGSPEKPLSDMGLVSYRNYWRLVLCRYFLKVMDGEDYKKGGLSIKRISDDTGMTPDDVISALEGLRALVRDPQTKLYAFRVDVDYCRQYVAKWEAKGYVQLKAEALAWTPYVMGRSNALNFELGPAINTIAPREDDEAKIQEGPNTAGAETQPILNGAKRTASDSGVELKKESAEPNEETGQEAVESIEKVASNNKENAPPQDQEIEHPRAEDAETWTLPYRNIPPSRFEVFPPVAGSRRADRSRQSASRPAVPRTVSSSSRPKRPSGSSRRPTAARPKSKSSKSSNSKRRSGGTGRGPGRWPKGTKKADYGNADSGPGLPPGWKEKRKTTNEDKDPDKTNGGIEEEPAEDSVFVSTTAETNGPVVDGEEDRDASGAETDPEHNDDNAEEDVDAEGEDA